MTNRWNRETVIEACVALDAERLEQGIVQPITQRELNAHSLGDPEIPSPKTIAEYIGDMDDLQAVLGRVTTKIALGWTDEQWQENAQLNLGLLWEQGIPHMSAEQVKQLSKMGLQPNLQAISRKWGNLPAYRQATGTETRSVYYEAKNWDKAKHRENGREFAEYLGKDFGMPVVPRDKDLSLGAVENRTPTVKQILAVYPTLDDYREDIGFILYDTPRKWTDEQWQENYQWLRDVWRQNGREITNLRNLLMIAGRLHIGPSMDAVIERWGSMGAYGRAMGHETSHKRKLLPNEGLLRAAIQQVVDTQQPITQENVTDNPYLSDNIATHHFGGTIKLNLRLGIINNTTGWDNNMLLWWGATSFMPETGTLPTQKRLDDCSRQNRGPSSFKVVKAFGGSVAYREQLVEAERWMDHQINRFNPLVNSPATRLDRELVRQAITRNPALFHPGEDIAPEELGLFYRLKEAGVDMRHLTAFMAMGIPFEKPETQLNVLAGMLNEKGVLNSSVLRGLETYIIGLATPEPEMSWNDFVLEYRRNLKRDRKLTLLNAGG